MKWNPKPWNEKQKAEFERLFHEKLEEWLDEGAGSCLFRERDNRMILEEVLMKAQGKWAEHEAWVIMPNHVHILFRPLMPLQDLVKVWKGVSARRMKEGSIWQKDYRDRLIRDQEHFQNRSEVYSKESREIERRRVHSLGKRTSQRSYLMERRLYCRWILRGRGSVGRQ